jgi:solute carrier family 1 (glutamate transporter), member 7
MENKERVSIETQTDFAAAPIINEDTINIETDESIDYQKELCIEKLSRILNYLKIAMINNLMLILINISAALGIGISILLKTYTSLSYDAKIYFAFPGELFVRALKFISLPLVFFNLITGMSGLTNKSKKIGLYALMFYSLSLGSSLLVGFLIVLTIQPGYRSSSISNIVKQNTITQSSTISDTILDILRNFIPGIFGFNSILRHHIIL